MTTSLERARPSRTHWLITMYAGCGTSAAVHSLARSLSRTGLPDLAGEEM